LINNVFIVSKNKENEAGNNNMMYFTDALKVAQEYEN
jgi:hypothetical protein